MKRLGPNWRTWPVAAQLLLLGRLQQLEQDEAIWKELRMTEPEMEKLIRAPEVAKMLQLPLPRVYEMTRAGVIPSVKILRQYRYSPSQLREWAKNGGTPLPRKGPQRNQHIASK